MLNSVTINQIQSITAIIALGLLTIQIYPKKLNIYFKYFMYLFIFIQPILSIGVRYFLYRRIDPFYMYTDLCILCDSRAEYIINFVRITFYSVSAAIFAPYLKLSKQFDQIATDFAYLVGFYSLSLYLFFTSPYTNLMWYKIFFLICQFMTVISIINRIKVHYISRGKVK